MPLARSTLASDVTRLPGEPQHGGARPVAGALAVDYIHTGSDVESQHGIGR